MNEQAAIWESIDALSPWKDNPRKNNGAISHVAESIKRFGFASPIIARSADKTIIAGHTRYEAAKKLGLEKIPVRYLDLDPADSRLLALADNKIGEIAEWDEDKLEKVMQELLDEGISLDDIGWSDDELGKIVDELKQEEIKEDEVPEADEEGEPDSKLGEVYELGEHRLICGDSTHPETWEKLMQGEKAELLFTDPPYGMSFKSNRHQKFSMIKNDNAAGEDLLNLVIKPIKQALNYSCTNLYICFTWRYYSVFEKAIKENNLEIKSCIVWNKKNFGMGNLHRDYRPQHEFIFYCTDGEFYGDRSQSDVWSISRENTSGDQSRLDYKHPTQKPVAIPAKAIINSSKKNNLIVDAFGGSGSTLIAAAQTKRRARLVELDPKYCDVIRRRWTQYAKDHNLEVGPG